MPVNVSYPGVYIQELPVNVQTLTGVATSITAFIGRTLRGPVEEPVLVRSFTEFESDFGGLWRDSSLSYALEQFFQNSGTDALIVRVHNGARPATVTLASDFILVAANPGNWGEKLRVRVDHDTHLTDDLFNLSLRDTGSGTTERFNNLSINPDSTRFVTHVLERQSTLVRVMTAPLLRPQAHGIPPVGSDPLLDDASSTAFAATGGDGSAITDDHISAAKLKTANRGIWALEKADLFNLLCIPPLTFEPSGDVNAQTRNAAADYCQQRRAIYIADPLVNWTHPADPSGTSGLGSATWGLARSANAALYFPRLRLPDPLQQNRLTDFAPCGAIAGIIAQTDRQRGVWKAPAGFDAVLSGVVELTINLGDNEIGQLNRMAVNCLRTLPPTRTVVWGARTLLGSEPSHSEWKYLPVRRFALFLEESLYRGTQWAVFEPNAETLWATIRRNIGAFMHDLFRQGAFQGSTPREAYFIKCDTTTTCQKDINQGFVNIMVGFAPLKPAEFVVINIRQVAGQI